MRTLNRDNLPHLISCFTHIVCIYWHTTWTRLAARWWGVQLGRGCSFMGRARFKRHPGSRIMICGNNRFNSSPVSNWIGVNRPCMISTLKDDAFIKIGEDCGFSGTVIRCASGITLGRNVRCGANTLIYDSDGHNDDFRAHPDAPIYIGDNVWLGAYVMVMKGVTIGEGTFIGAGSLVTKSLPAHVVAAGIPARVIRSLEQP